MSQQLVAHCFTSLTSIKEKYIVYRPIGSAVESKLIAIPGLSDSSNSIYTVLARFLPRPRSR